MDDQEGTSRPTPSGLNRQLLSPRSRSRGFAFPTPFPRMTVISGDSSADVTGTPSSPPSRSSPESPHSPDHRASQLAPRARYRGSTFPTAFQRMAVILGDSSADVTGTPSSPPSRSPPETPHSPDHTASQLGEDQSDIRFVITELRQYIDEELAIQRSALENETRLREDQIAAERDAWREAFAEERMIRGAALRQYIDEELAIQRSALENERRLREDQIVAERDVRREAFAEERMIRGAELMAAKKAWTGVIAKDRRARQAVISTFRLPITFCCAILSVLTLLFWAISNKLADISSV